MEVFLIKALQLMLSLSILVLLHEGGHFFFSKYYLRNGLVAIGWLL